MALKKRLNISEVQYSAPAAVAAPVAAAAPVEDAPEEVAEEVKKVQTEFSLTMTGYDEKSKIKREFNKGQGSESRAFLESDYFFL